MGGNNEGIENAIQLIKGVLDGFPAFVFVVGENGGILYHNSEAKRIMGEDMKQIYADRLLNTDEKDPDGNALAEYEIEYSNRWYKVSDTQIVWIDAKYARLVVGTDITQLKNSEVAFKESASIDSMTGIYNRQTGIDVLEQFIDEVKNGGNIFTICYLDINDLKYTNDTFGHSEGDLYINSVVSVIKNAIRQTDIFARMGGDEFLIVFPQCPYEVVENIMGTVVTRLDVMNETSENKDLQYSISFGMMEVNTETQLDSEFILNAVDSKMYYMKEEYRRTKKQPK